MNPLISIIVPVYNVEEYLHASISSLINQTYKNLQIILIDDGSPDSCGSICDDFAKIDDRILVIHQKNSGVVAARIAGLKLATGEYIGFMDPDDLIEPDMFQYMMEKMLIHNVDIVSVGRWVEYTNDTILYCDKVPSLHTVSSSTRSSFSSKLLNKTDFYVTMWNKLYKKYIPLHFYTQIPNSMRAFDDTAFTYSYLPFIDSVYVGDRAFYYQNKKNLNSITNNFNLRSLESLIKLYHHVDKLYVKSTEYSSLKPLLDSIFTRTLLQFFPSNFAKTFYEGIFPLSSLCGSKKFIIYGAGNIGLSYYKQLSAIDTFEVVAIVDKYKFNELLTPTRIHQPSEIANFTYDYILIAVKNESLALTIIDDLTKNYSICKNQLIWTPPTKIIDFIEGLYY